MIQTAHPTLSLVDQAQIAGWRVAVAATRLATRVWRDLAPILYPLRYFFWVPPLVAVFGFFIGIGMALAMR